jgi:hypothetical protein
MKTFKTTVTLYVEDNQGNEIEMILKVEYSYYGGFRGSLEEPAEDSEITIQSVTYNGFHFEPTPEQEEKIIQECWFDYEYYLTE